MVCDLVIIARLRLEVIMQKVRKAEDIVLLLRKVEILINQGKTVPILCKESGISEHTYYKWRREYGGLDVSQSKELKRLKEENGRLKKAVADLGQTYS